MKVALITGPCLPGRCGVGDYTARLCESLRAIGVDAHVFSSGDWRLPHVFETRQLLRDLNADVLHIQYPTAGFGRKLGPQALSLSTRCVITIHELSARRLPRQLSLFPFALRPRRVIFTSKYERKFALRFAPWLVRRSAVIPVGSNIPVLPHAAPEIPSEIVYFGLIMPNKGLEKVIELAEHIRDASLSYSIDVVGQVPAGAERYFETIKQRSERLPIRWTQGLDDAGIAKLLSQTAVAYLPYPDGASDRRTSLKSALSAGVAVITNRGEHTSNAMANSVLLSSNPEGALSAIQALFEHPETIQRLSARAIQYSRRYEWDRIARSHIRVYRSVLEENASKA